ncbi:ABC transporter substrate-binding protein [Thermohalobacter berrensis]|uniref:Fe/B12 periplasmic-binding domain-containing protein n=1 Tax=Thermohalobacter berrensis TaxID=99594 RepID=A0A419T4S6_9FIRM|nr:iron-siderophore ABC transporter substrate-binding protein [Thermohalobacter berrensis]RKD32446.1 hypothetical protein BET03_11055 [Thermohalobacter berrensis]
MLNRIKISKIAIFMLIGILFLTGCSTQGTVSNDETSSNKSEEESLQTRIIEHAMGKTEINGTPKRVVVLVNGMVDISLALGVKPIGAVESWIGDPWYKYIEDDMEGVKPLGKETQPNLELIASLKPDIILGSKMRHEKIYEQLSSIAPTIMSENVFDWKANLKLVSKALNKEEKGEKIVEDWNKRVKDFKNKLGDKASLEISLIRFNPDHARIYYTGFPGMIIEEVGLSRPESQRVKDKVVGKLTKERIPEMDGDIIFDFTADWKGDGQVEKLREEWMNDPLWKNLKAVKEGKVYRVNEVHWNMAGGVIAANKMLDDLYEYILNE